VGTVHYYYFEQVTGSYTTATFVLSVEFFASALFDIDRHFFGQSGRKYTLFAGSAIFALGLFCYAAAHGLPLLFLGALLLGLSVALFSGNNDALLFETLKSLGKEKRFHHYQGKASSMFQIGLAQLPCSPALSHRLACASFSLLPSSHKFWRRL